MNESLDEKKRALKAVKAIDAAVAEVSRLHPQLCTKRAAWEHDDLGVSELLRVTPGGYRLLQGAIRCLDYDVELAVRVGRDDDGVLDSVAILAVLDEPLALPPDPGELCDALACCFDHSVIPQLEPDESTGEVVVYSVAVDILTESLSGKILRDALDRLSKTTVLLRAYLSQDNGDEQRPVDGPIA